MTDKKSFSLMRILFFILTAFLTWIASPVIMGFYGYAQTSESTQTSKVENLTGKIDRYHQLAGTTLLSSAKWVDSFFRTENYTAEQNKTFLQVQLTGFLEDREGFDSNARFKLKLQLPHTKKRLRLVVGSDPDAIDTLDDSPIDTIRDRPGDIEDKTTIGLEHSRGDRGNQNLKFTGGVRVRNDTLVGFGRGRYRYLKKYDLWDIRFTEQLRWYTDNGWDSRSDIDFERPVTEHLFFRTTPTLDWYENEDGFYYGLHISLYHTLNQTRALEYQFNNYFSTELPGQLKESNLRIRYRQRIWRDWLTLEVTPQLAWYESRDFETIPGILVQFEIWLGHFKTSETDEKKLNNQNSDNPREFE